MTDTFPLFNEDEKDDSNEKEENDDEEDEKPTSPISTTDPEEAISTFKWFTRTTKFSKI